MRNYRGELGEKMTECDKWLDTVTDSELDGHSQSSLANEAWMRGAAYAAQEILNHLEVIDTVKVAVRGSAAGATAISRARVTADRFIKMAATVDSENFNVGVYIDQD